MISRLVGLYQDGNDPALGIVTNAARTLRQPLGATHTVRLEVVNPAGVPVDLTGTTLVLSVRRQTARPAAPTSSASSSCSCGGASCGGCSGAPFGRQELEDAADVSTAVPAADITVAGVLAPTRGKNHVDFAIVAADTADLDPGRFTYDIWWTHGGARDCVVPLSPFVLEPVVTFP